MTAVAYGFLAVDCGPLLSISIPQMLTDYIFAFWGPLDFLDFAKSKVWALLKAMLAACWGDIFFTFLSVKSIFLRQLCVQHNMTARS